MITYINYWSNNIRKIKNGNEVLFRFHFLGVGSLTSGGFSVILKYGSPTEEEIRTFIKNFLLK